MQNAFSPISANLSNIQGLNPTSVGTSSPIGIGSPVGDVGDTQEGGGARSFKDTLASALDTVNEHMEGAKKASEAMLSGEVDNLHDVTIAGAKAEIYMKLTTTIASKLAQATTQLFQMQV